MNVLEQISHETMVFMRGKYCLDEIGNEIDELKFKQGQKTILTIYTHKDRSVSYTHLDVYKRQFLLGVMGGVKTESIRLPGAQSHSAVMEF